MGEKIEICEGGFAKFSIPPPQVLKWNSPNMNPRLLWDLYEPWTCMFHPLAIMARPDWSGLHIK